MRSGVASSAVRKSTGARDALCAQGLAEVAAIGVLEPDVDDEDVGGAFAVLSAAPISAPSLPTTSKPSSQSPWTRRRRRSSSSSTTWTSAVIGRSIACLPAPRSPWRSASEVTQRLERRAIERAQRREARRDDGDQRDGAERRRGSATGPRHGKGADRRRRSAA